ncbi:MAG: DNRLRE domain-containing protein [Anaerolineales bacterium]|nr:DNRLRE domain-containing protein [Anaerolineales bacterium]
MEPCASTLPDNDSILDETSLPLGGLGAGNGNYSSGDVYVINKAVPTVTSILRLDPSPTAAGSARFTVTFSESVTGVDAADFALTVSSVSDAGVASVSGSGTTYTVTIFTGNGDGSLRLDLLDNDSILDAGLSPLGGAGLGNANFYNGETYTIDRAAPLIQTMTFYSDGAHDGWILEGKETSNKGGTMNSSAAVLRVGDNAQDNQYRSILHFPTSTLPDNAAITQAILTLQMESVVGANPFKTHRNIWVDIRQGAFGSFGPLQIGALQNSDFQAAALYTAGTILDNAVGGWYWATLDAKALPLINLKGVTQFRLGFLLDDDDDRKDDYISFLSGNYSVTTARPQLTVRYFVP